jgi:hypothetical protein
MSFTVFRSKSVNLNNLHPSKRIIFIDSALERYPFLVSAFHDKAQVTVLNGNGRSPPSDYHSPKKISTTKSPN